MRLPLLRPNWSANKGSPLRRTSDHSHRDLGRAGMPAARGSASGSSMIKTGLRRARRLYLSNRMNSAPCPMSSSPQASVPASQRPHGSVS
jgi:hypothetical protein